MRLIVRHVGRLVICALLLGLTWARAGNEAEVRQHLDFLRGIQPTKDDAALKRINTRMDEAWGFFDAHKQNALPVLQQALQTETEAKVPDQFFLLDLSFWLVRADAAHTTGLALAALERIDPAAAVIRANDRELLELVLKLGTAGSETERYLRQVDRIYLANGQELNFFAAPHVVKLSTTDLLGLAYGVAGEAAAAHLCDEAAKPGTRQLQLVRILSAVCDENQAERIAAIWHASRDDEISMTVVAALMTIGGPKGRAAVRAYDASKATAAMQKNLSQVHDDVEAMNLAYFDRVLESIYPPKRMSDREVQQALDSMEKRNGADDSTPPINVFRSKLDPEKTLAQLKRIRARSFRRMNNRVFEDLPVSNLLINAFQYKCAVAK